MNDIKVVDNIPPKLSFMQKRTIYTASRALAKTNLHCERESSHEKCSAKTENLFSQNPIW
jgi:hypothetical protein